MDKFKNIDKNRGASERQVTALKWILSSYYMEENKIENNSTNRRLYQNRLYGSLLAYFDGWPTHGQVNQCFDKFKMVKNAEGNWECGTTNKLPKELSCLVKTDEPKATKETTKKAPKTATKKSATVSARKKAPADKKPVKLTMTADQKADAIALLQERLDALLES